MAISCGSQLLRFVFLDRSVLGQANPTTVPAPISFASRPSRSRLGLTNNPKKLRLPGIWRRPTQCDMIAARFGHFFFWPGHSDIRQRNIGHAGKMHRRVFRLPFCNNSQRSKAIKRRANSPKRRLLATPKTAFYQDLTGVGTGIVDIATGKEPRPPELDKFAAVFSVAGEKAGKGRRTKRRRHC